MLPSPGQLYILFSNTESDAKGRNELDGAHIIIYADKKKRTLAKTCPTEDLMNPQWNEEFVMVIPRQDSQLYLAIIQKNSGLKKDKVVATAHLDWRGLTPWSHNEKLVVMNDHIKVKARMQFAPMMVPNSTPISTKMPELRFALERTAYYPGELMRGVLIHTVSKVKAVKNLKLTFDGFNFASWLDDNGVSDDGYFWAKHQYFSVAHSFSGNKTADGDTDYLRKHNHYDPNEEHEDEPFVGIGLSVGAGIIQLDLGVNYYPFQFSLPMNIPHSFVHGDGAFGNFYFVSATLTLGNGSEKHNNLAFNVLPPKPILEIDPTLSTSKYEAYPISRRASISSIDFNGIDSNESTPANSPRLQDNLFNSSSPGRNHSHQQGSLSSIRSQPKGVDVELDFGGDKEDVLADSPTNSSVFSVDEGLDFAGSSYSSTFSSSRYSISPSTPPYNANVYSSTNPFAPTATTLPNGFNSTNPSNGFNPAAIYLQRSLATLNHEAASNHKRNSSAKELGRQNSLSGMMWDGLHNTEFVEAEEALSPRESVTRQSSNSSLKSHLMRPPPVTVTGFAPPTALIGEPFVFQVHLENHSSKPISSLRIQVKYKLYLTGYKDGKVNHHLHSKCFPSVAVLRKIEKNLPGFPVAPGTAWEGDVIISIPKNLTPSAHVKHIHIDYDLKVEAKLSSSLKPSARSNTSVAWTQPIHLARRKSDVLVNPPVECLAPAEELRVVAPTVDMWKYVIPTPIAPDGGIPIKGFSLPESMFA